jgi:CIC family chloride channel protein
MTHDVFALRGQQSPEDAIGRITSEDKRYHAYPVLGGEGELLGVVTHYELERHADMGSVAEIIEGQELLAVGPDTPIRDAANRMIARNLQQVPVVSPLESDRLLGWLTLNDIARQQNAVEG